MIEAGGENVAEGLPASRGPSDAAKTRRSERAGGQGQEACRFKDLRTEAEAPSIDSHRSPHGHLCRMASPRREEDCLR